MSVLHTWSPALAAGPLPTFESSTTSPPAKVCFLGETAAAALTSDKKKNINNQLVGILTMNMGKPPVAEVLFLLVNISFTLGCSN